MTLSKKRKKEIYSHSESATPNLLVVSISSISLRFLQSLHFNSFAFCQPSHIMKPNQSGVDLQSPSFVKHKLDSDKESVLPKPELEEQDPFGDESQAGVKYKTMAWWQAGMSKSMPCILPSFLLTDPVSHDRRNHLAWYSRVAQSACGTRSCSVQSPPR